eukprot:gene38011-46183_t
MRVSPLQCLVGYGQRGLIRSSDVSWTRYCPLTDYCFEAVTNDITKVKQLIDFPWDAYYKEFFVRSCGGDYGTKATGYHPWRGLPQKARRKIGSVKINLTTPVIITGEGGTQELNLKYTCRKDLCTKVVNAAPAAILKTSFQAALACSGLVLALLLLG